MFSTSSSLTTIFDGNSEPRYEELRAERKLITKSIKDFREKRRKFDAVTDEELNADFGLVDEGMDVDTMRSDIALNIRTWISRAHESLDINAYVDREMLARMSGYVEHARLFLIKNPKILESDNEKRILCDLPIPSMVLPLKNQSPSLPPSNIGNEVRDNEFRAEDASDPPLATGDASLPLVGAIGGVVDNQQKRKRVRRKKSLTLDALHRGNAIPSSLPTSNFLAMRNDVTSQQQQPPQRQDVQLPVNTPRPPVYGNVINDDMVSALSEEAALRLRMMALSQVKEMRPPTKFSSGSSMEFRNRIIRFDAAVNIPGMTDALRLMELKHHFSGIAESIIDAHIACPDAGDEYQKARSEIAFLFGGSSNSILPAIREIIDGPQVLENDVKAHLQLYAELVKLQSLAVVTSQQSQLNHADNLAEIVESRLAYTANEWWQKDLRRQEEEGLRNSFVDLKKLMQDAIHILRSRQNFAPQNIDLTSSS